MFCPQCGQRQLSNEVRFCSNCGFPLNMVSEVLASGGRLQFRPAPPQGTGQLSPRQKGVRQGVMLMLSTFLIVPVLAILGVALLDMPEQFVALAAVVCFIGGLLRILYAVFLEENMPAGTVPHMVETPYVPPQTLPSYLGTPARNPSLPPAQSPPANAYRPPRYDTGELAQPPIPSVTDHTTRLLNKEPEEPPQK